MTRMAEKRGAYKMFMQKREEERGHLEDVGVGGWTMLKLILKVGWDGAE